MRVGIIIYHSNIRAIYKKRWIEKCLDSLWNQTFKDYVVYELCYSEQPEQLWEGSIYEHRPLPNHIYAMNHILGTAFTECDVVANVNLDDSYALNRLELQLEAIKQGYELVSNDFRHIEEQDGEDVWVRDMIFSSRCIKEELAVLHNTVCHSSVMYSKSFWEKYRYYNVDELGYEDRNLWIKAVAGGCKIHIVPEILCDYRLSPLQTGRINPCI